MKPDVLITVHAKYCGEQARLVRGLATGQRMLSPSGRVLIKSSDSHVLEVSTGRITTYAWNMLAMPVTIAVAEPTPTANEALAG